MACTGAAAASGYDKRPSSEDNCITKAADSAVINARIGFWQTADGPEVQLQFRVYRTAALFGQELELDDPLDHRRSTSTDRTS